MSRASTPGVLIGIKSCLSFLDKSNDRKNTVRSFRIYLAHRASPKGPAAPSAPQRISANKNPVFAYENDSRSREAERTTEGQNQTRHDDGALAHFKNWCHPSRTRLR